MKLKDVARDIKRLLLDDCGDVLIWKYGKSWYYASLVEDGEAKALVKKVKAIDPYAIQVNGPDDFAIYTIGYIAFRIREIYEDRTESKSRANGRKTVVYTHDCVKECSNRGHWSKLVSQVNRGKVTSTALEGQYLKFGDTHNLTEGDIVVEVCGIQAKAYRIVVAQGKVLIGTAKITMMDDLIQTVADELEGKKLVLREAEKN